MPVGSVADKGTNPDSAAWDAALKHRPTYAKSLGEYASVYQVKERGMKKWLEESRRDWITAGCPAGGPDFPPLDEPSKMLAWWLAHKTHAPSDVLLTLAGKTSEDVAPTKTKTPLAESTEAKREAIDVGALAGMDLSSAAVKQRQLLEAAHQALVRAQADSKTPEATITLLQKRWDETFERLRKTESSLIADEKQRGERPHLNDIRAELTPLLTHLAGSLVDLLCSKLGVARPRAKELADEWFRDLRASRFGTAVPLQAPAPAGAAA